MLLNACSQRVISCDVKKASNQEQLFMHAAVNTANIQNRCPQEVMTPTWSSLERLGAMRVTCVSIHLSMPFIVCGRSDMQFALDNSWSSRTTHAKLAIDNALSQTAHYQSPEGTKRPHMCHHVLPIPLHGCRKSYHMLPSVPHHLPELPVTLLSDTSHRRSPLLISIKESMPLCITTQYSQLLLLNFTSLSIVHITFHAPRSVSAHQSSSLLVPSHPS